MGITLLLLLLLAGDSTTSILPNIIPPLQSSSCMDAFHCLRRSPGCNAYKQLVHTFIMHLQPMKKAKQPPGPTNPFSW